MAGIPSDRLRATVLGIARAMFIDRLHVLRLTEVVRHQIRPTDDGILQLPDELDKEMKNQAFDFVLATLPQEYHGDIYELRSSWMNVH